ncbi:MAG: lysophospholipid acyltransferase family protein [Acidimicrobiia bacterium]|nr:lysophospholipid acyltransferase family protein [Acidimicrobiia bacterium]
MIRNLCRALLRIRGWTLLGSPPQTAKYVVIAAPHTSNWDFPIMLAMAGAFGLRLSWMGKDSLFRAPFGFIMRRLGGVPVKRHTAHNVVDQTIAAFEAAERFVLAIPAEGTRSRTEHWKSGFYHIARGARVPIAPAFLDYSKKEGGFRPAIEPTGDIKADMDLIRAAYEGVLGKKPSNQGPIRLAQEIPSSTPGGGTPA